MTLDLNKYIGQIRDILTAPGVDLGTISAKRVRKQLLEQNEELTPDLVKEHKEDIDALIGSVYEQVSAEAGGDEAEDESDESVKRKYEDGDAAADAPAPKKPKKGSSPTDEEVARQLNKEINGRERNARAAAPKGPKAGAKRGKKRAKSAAVVDSEGEGSVDPEAKPKRRGGFTKEYLLRSVHPCAPHCHCFLIISTLCAASHWPSCLA